MKMNELLSLITVLLDRIKVGRNPSILPSVNTSHKSRFTKTNIHDIGEIMITHKRVKENTDPINNQE